jgi:prepilin-type N-terminal cleavage/methylation domain-containing protein
MKHPSTRRPPGRGFSLIELLVVVVILAILASMGYTALWRGRTMSKDAVCRNNLKQIAGALGLYYNDHRLYPAENLPSALLPYVGDNPDLFICPADPDPRGDSYSRFYVPRTEDDSQSYVCGCPRHVDATRTITLFSSASAQMLEAAPVMWNGQEVPPGTSVGSGMLRFGDGSTVLIPHGMVVRLIQSFRLHDGRHYSLVGLDINETGSVHVTVTPGSRFEVVTPAAIAGVQGTRFRVNTEIEGTLYRVTVKVQRGRVWVRDRWRREQPRVLDAHESRTVECPRVIIRTQLPSLWDARRIVLPDDGVYDSITSLDDAGNLLDSTVTPSLPGTNGHGNLAP